jgi:glycosyltransferase involved in cell wall biosynthesis
MLTTSSPPADSSLAHLTASSRNLRLAVISDAIPGRNGVGTYYADLIDHLRPYLSRIDFIGPGEDGPSSYGRLTLPLPGDRTQKICLPSYFRILRQVKELNPQVLIVPTPGPFGLLAKHWAKPGGSRIIAGLHTDFRRLAEIYDSPLIGRLGQHYVRYSHQLLFRASDRIVTMAPEMIKAGQLIGGQEITLMGTLVPYAYLQEPLAPPPQKIRRILFAGRLAPEKNLPALIKAAESLPQIEFSLAGEGPLRPQLEEQTRELSNVQLLGWRSREQLRDQLDQSDMLVLPSLVESFGTVALEAMARGRLVLVSAHCGLLQWPELAPCVIAQRPEESLIQAISRVAEMDPGAMAKLADQAHQAALAWNHWSLEGWLRLLVNNGH